MKFLILLIILISGTVYGQNRIQDISVHADSFTRDLKKRRVILTGNVKLIYKNQELTCDEAVIDLNDRRVDASGNIQLTSDNAILQGTKLKFNLDSKMGTVFNGTVTSGQVQFAGDEIEKVGESDYVAKNAKYTACTNCPPSWSFTGTKIEARIGGYAYIKLPILRVVDFPVFLLPGIWVPLKSDRQSGVLVPKFGYTSNGGLSVALSYFWAISRSEDMTLTAKNYPLKGFKSLMEYRYVLSKESYGDFNTAYINDRAFEAFNDETKTIGRWFLTYNHHYVLPHDFIQRFNIAAISDLRYLRDYPEEIEGHGDPALENKASITKNWHDAHFSIESDYYLNLLKEDPLERNDDSVHRFPEIRYSLMNRKIGDSNFFYNANANYVNFTRNGYSYDDVKTNAEYLADVASACGTDESAESYSTCKNRVKRIKDTPDGDFDPNLDIIRTGQRLTMDASLFYPLHYSNLLAILPKLTYQETRYTFTTEPNSAFFAQESIRRNIESEITFNTLLSNRYSGREDKGDKTNLYEHKIEPEITFAQTLSAERPNNPFFGNFEDQPYSNRTKPLSESDFFDSDGNLGDSRVQFDYRDRLFDKRIIKFGVTNRLTRKSWLDETAIYKDYVIWNLSQSYDFNEAQEQDPKPLSEVESNLQLNFQHISSTSTFKIFPYADVVNTYSTFRVFNAEGHYAQLGYAREWDINEDKNVETGIKSETMDFSVGLIGKYVDLVGKIDYSVLDSKVTRWKYKGYLKPPGKCWGIQFEHEQVTDGDTRFLVNLKFDYGGDKSLDEKLIL